MKKTLLIISFLWPFNIFAVTFHEALTLAYNNAENFKLIRNDYLKEMEAFPQALSNFLPDVRASIDSGHSKLVSGNNSPTQWRKETNKNINLRQPLFRGGGSVASLKAAQSSFHASRASYYSKEQKVVLEALEVYLQVYSAQEKYIISLTSLESTKKQLNAAEEKLKIGESTQSEYATAIAGMADAETRSLGAYAELQAAKANFAKIFGIEPTDIVLPEIPNELPNSMDVLLAKVSAYNFDIEQYKYSLDTAKTREFTAKSKLLPQVDFTVRGGKNGAAYDSDGIYRNQSSVYTGISVNIPIYSNGGAEYSSIRQSKNETRRVALLTDQKIKEIQTACVKSWEGFNAQKISIVAATEGEKAAQIAYDSVFEEEQVGSKTMLDVLNVLDRLNKTKLNKVDVLVAYTKNAYELKSLVSELTVKDLKLDVPYFNPEQEFKKSKIKIIGF